MKLRNPVPAALTAIAALWNRISSAIGRSQAERAKQQQPEIDRMDAEIQGITKEPPDVK